MSDIEIAACKTVHEYDPKLHSTFNDGEDLSALKSPSAELKSPTPDHSDPYQHSEHRRSSHSSSRSIGEIDLNYNAQSGCQSNSPRTSRSSRSSRSSNSSRQASVSGHNLLKLNYRLKYTLKGHRGPVSQVRFSPDGRWIASCSADATIKVWDTATGNHIRTMEGHLAGISTISWSPDSETIASGSDDKVIRLWHRATGKPYPVPLLGHHNYVYSLSFSPKGNMLASGSYDEAVFIWDLRARRILWSLPAHSDPVGSVDFIHDGTLICSCSTDGLIRVWETSSGQCLRTLVHEDNAPVTNVCFSPNGRYILAWTLDSCIRLWDYVLGNCMKTYQGHVNKKYSLGGAFGASGLESFIVSGSEDGHIIFWDVKSKVEIQRVLAHESVVCWVDTYPESNMVVSGGLDGIVQIWVDVSAGEENVEGMNELCIEQKHGEMSDLGVKMETVSDDDIPTYKGIEHDYENGDSRNLSPERMDES